MDKPNYPHGAISTIDKLARTLGVSPKRLISIANKVDDSYVSHDLKGKNRTVFDPKYELKKIQKRLNSRLFELVEYPTYLQGGIKADLKRDYVENAKIHANAETLISLDIKKFYTNIKSESVYDIYKNFFHFPDETAEILTKLTTYKGKVPQGGCTSSYLANLVFFNSEYLVVSAFRGKGIRYSRLLDDVTLSSTKNLSAEQCSEMIRSVVSIFTKRNLKLNTSKTKIEYRGKATKGFEVTGLWVEHKKPKLRKKERKYIRQLVYICEQEYLKDKTNSDYHKLWNKTSGKVAKMSRLGHPQHGDLRNRLRAVMPIFNEDAARKIKKLVMKSIKVPKEQHKRIGRINDYNKLMYRIGVLKRSCPGLSKKLTSAMKTHYSSIPTKKEYWLE